jgi:hypothetical protein
VARVREGCGEGYMTLKKRAADEELIESYPRAGVEEVCD